MRRTALRLGLAFVRHWCRLWLASTLALCAPLPLRASDAAGQRVLLVGHEPDAFLERVGAEVEKLGFSLIRSQATGPLEDAARAEGAVAALRALPSNNGIEVWMADATSGRSLLRQMVIDESPRGPDRELIALQTAELLRTSLRAEKPAAEPLAVSVRQEPRSASRAKTSGVDVACGALYSPGGARPALVLGLSLQHFPSARWGVGLDVAVPLRPGKIEAAEGSAKLATHFAGALGLLRFQGRGNPWFATLGAGAAVLVVSYDGETSEPLQASTGAQTTGAGYVRADFGIEAASWMRFGVRTLVGASFQRISITFAGNEAGSFGPALLGGLLLAELALP